MLLSWTVDRLLPIQPETIKERAVGFSSSPSSWYYLGTLREMKKGPIAFELPEGRKFVGYLKDKRTPVVLSARCSHLGADLSRGCVHQGRIICPLHGWEYASDGRCERIPASAEIPKFARQISYPVSQHGGHVFFFNAVEPRFPFPFFEGIHSAELLAAPRFEFIVQAPWYLVSANGFDLQHFRCAHDRVLCGEPVIDSPHRFAQRLTARFRVVGTSVYDRLTRWFSGEEVEMSVTNWCGNLVLVTAKFRRTTSYGLVSFVPLDTGQTLVRDLVWIPRSSTSLGRAVIDPIDARIRRIFIREFVRSDVDRSAGIRFDRSRMIEADKVLVDYLDWLRPVHR